MSLSLHSFDPSPAAIAPREKHVSLWRALARALYLLACSGGDSPRAIRESFKAYGSRTLRFRLGSYELEATIDPERVREINVTDELAELFMGPVTARFAGQVARSFAKRAAEWPGGVFDLEWSHEAAMIARCARSGFSHLGVGSTTTHLPGWFGQLLADHPDVQCLLRDELQMRGHSPALLESAPYLEALILEALRLYPPAPFFLKRGARSCSLIPIQAMHRSEELWESPDDFLPERWLARNGEVIPAPAHYLPFGAGPWVGIGKRFALIELKVILSELIRRYRIVPAVSGSRPRSPVRLFCLPAFGIGTAVATLVPDEKASDAGRRYDRSGGK